MPSPAPLPSPRGGDGDEERGARSRASSADASPSLLSLSAASSSGRTSSCASSCLPGVSVRDTRDRSAPKSLAGATALLGSPPSRWSRPR